MNNSAIVIRVNNITPHPDPETIGLELVNLFGTQVVVRKGSYNIGDILCYVDSNMKLSPEYLSANNEYRNSELNQDKSKSGYFDDNGRVKCIKLRGEVSDGYLFPLESLLNIKGISEKDIENLKPDTEFNEVNGILICEKYIPKVKVSEKKNKGRKAPESPMFVEHFDTSQFFRSKDNIPENSIVYIEAKWHGTSGRIARALVDTTNEKPWYKKLFMRMAGIESTNEYRYLHGTRRVVLSSPEDHPTSFHDNDMRYEILEAVKGNLFKGEEIYFEIIGYDKSGAHIQKGFPYGCNQRQYKVMLYRVTMNNEDGKVFDMSRKYVYKRAEELGFLAPHLYEKFYFGKTNMEKLEKRVVDLSQGQEVNYPDTLKEGVVLWFINKKGNWEALKYKSDAFRANESKLKDKGINDIEDVS